MILVFWMLSFNPTFSVSSFTFIKRLVSSSSLSAIRVVSSAYLRLLIFLLEILIPACTSFSPAFLLMYSAYKLNKQGDNIQPWHTSFPIWNQYVVPCPVLTVASWPAYRFLRRQSGLFLVWLGCLWLVGGSFHPEAPRSCRASEFSLFSWWKALERRHSHFLPALAWKCHHDSFTSHAVTPGGHVDAEKLGRPLLVGISYQQLYISSYSDGEAYHFCMFSVLYCSLLWSVCGPWHPDQNPTRDYIFHQHSLPEWTNTSWLPATSSHVLSLFLAAV